ncbi:hypothetical protein TcWFU_004786 [Taenia crassiceps]|uniref:Uncharacterized protein n=1 Tax=Taenia crassiceps TaxID=6207 RepID=A0ABR4Q7A5_9CEST
MDRRVAYIIIALSAAILFFAAIGFNGWGCGDSILGPNCLKLKVHEVTGALLLTAGLLVLITTALLILFVATESGWSQIAATVVATIAAIISLAGVFYYLDHRRIWSPFIATIAMSLTVAITAILLFEIFTRRF